MWDKVFGSDETFDGGELNNVNIQGKGRTGDGKLYGGDGSGSFSDNFQRFVFETDQYNPIALAWDGMSGCFSGKDRLGNGLSGTESTVKMLSAIPITRVGSVTAKATTAIWSSTKKLSSVKNAFGHWKKHATEFPEFANAKQYFEGTKNFLHNSPTGTLIKTRVNGDMLKYHPDTNTFGVMDASGVPKTLFRPTDGMDYWLKQ